MIISDDQNTITLDDGTVLVAKEQDGCDGCVLLTRKHPAIRCSFLLCCAPMRKDRRNMIFIKKEEQE